MTSIPVDRHSEAEPDAAVVDLPSRARVRGGALKPVSGTAGVRFDRTAVRDVFQPPDVWSDRRPSLRDRWLYAWHGAWTGELTAMRYVGGVYAVLIGLPVAFVLHLTDWIFQRPARLFVALVLSGLVWLAF